MPEDTIGSWTVTQFTKFLKTLFERDPPKFLPAVAIDSLTINEALLVKGTVNFTGSDDVKVGSTGAAAFQNGWAAVSTQPPRYSKDALGVVHLAGATQSGTSGLAMFTLPPGYWPLYQVIVPVRAGGATFGSVIINTNGAVVHESGTTTLISLDGISYKARTT